MNSDPIHDTRVRRRSQWPAVLALNIAIPFVMLFVATVLGVSSYLGLALICAGLVYLVVAVYLLARQPRVLRRRHDGRRPD